MKNALLMGNGFSSQLIQAYQDVQMINKFKELTGELYYDINNLLNPYRNLENKSEKNIIEMLEKQHIRGDHYLRYFINQNLKEELYKPEITGLETLLKVAHLFHHIKEFSYDEIQQVFNFICFNNGLNGLDGITVNYNQDNLKEYINSFSDVYTTNYDTILDDLYENEVNHLHGGFFYNKIKSMNGSIFIQREEQKLCLENSYLIWGRNFEEKTQKTKGGFSFPISFPFSSGSSVLNKYFSKLECDDYEEIHIFGFSGLNDNHINERIKENRNVKKIVVYVSPSDVKKQAVKDQNILLYQNQYIRTVELKSWDTVWDRIKEN